LGHSVVNVHDLPPEGPGGAVRFVRRALGAQAFGINWFEVPPGMAGPEHDEKESGQEEVNVIVRGSGIYRVEGEEVAIEAGTVCRFDPETTRQLVAGPEGITMIAVGARRGSYEPRGPY
jgi:quercetin dioxygenase-like cupin family protein